MRRIMYIENKCGGLDGEGRIGWVELSRSRRTYDSQGRRLMKTGAGYKYNCIDEVSGNAYWVSGPRKDGADKLYGGIVQIDEDARVEYWTRIRNQPQHNLSNSDSIVVFDMGGVLYDFQGDRLIARTSRRARRWRREEVQVHWPALARGFETGSATDIEFAEIVVKRYELTLTPDEFLAEFRNAAVGFYEGALGLVVELRERHRVFSLSNTNPPQWSKVLADLGATDPFHAHHPSHVIGFHKPDPRAFQAVSRRIAEGTPCYFFDDRSENVEAARRFGWHARRVRGVTEARAACQEAGLL